MAFLQHAYQCAGAYLSIHLNGFTTACAMVSVLRIFVLRFHNSIFKDHGTRTSIQYSTELSSQGDPYLLQMGQQCGSDSIKFIHKVDYWIFYYLTTSSDASEFGVNIDKQMLAAKYDASLIYVKPLGNEAFFIEVVDVTVNELRDKKNMIQFQKLGQKDWLCYTETIEFVQANNIGQNAKQIQYSNGTKSSSGL
ncbi:hypothetical protein BDR04DRAFT_1117534 [Suillus decipiens]|nr:hypothetical protein BDR04DRAFT_1117534 [Suillus decipiens]